MKLSFGDVLINHWASDDNPNKVSVFVKRKKKTICVTNMKGKFWEQYSDSLDEGMIEKVGNIVSNDVKPLKDYLKLSSKSS